MPVANIALALLAAGAALEAQQLPFLRIEAVGGGSVFYVTNTASQPLTAWLIELVDYPGSSYSLFQDDVSAPLAPGAETKIPVSNMTVGAAPEHVKITAAVYADGATAGDAAKVALVLGRRKAVLETTRELIARIEKARAAGVRKAALGADLKQWADSQPETKSRRLTAAAVDQAATRQTILNAVAQLEQGSIDGTLTELRATERAIAASKL